MGHIELDKDERILKIVRKHPFPFLLQVAVLLIGLVLPAFLKGSVQYLIENSSIPAGEIAQALPLLEFGESLWYLFLWVFLFIAWTDYYLDRWVITNKRVLASEQNGLFNRENASVRHINIQDIKSEVIGIIATLLDFGTLTVQSAAESREFIMHTAPSPYALKTYLNDLHDQILHKKHPPSP